jgi:hypothetical protein
LARAVTKLGDKYRPSQFGEGASPVSWLNESIEYRDRGAATILHRWPRETPLRAVLLDALAQTQLLLARLESGVYLAKDAAGRRAEHEETIQQLYLRTQDQVRVLEAALELDLE